MDAFHVLCFLLGLATGNGFLLGDKKDCTISQWTPWSRPYSPGLRFRERKILHPATGGGAHCPDDLMDTKTEHVDGDPVLLPVPVTANLIIDDFLRPKPTKSKRGINPVNMTRDLLLIVDSSRSITASEFRTSVIELATLLATLCPEKDPFDSNYNRAALIEFSTSLKEVFQFDTYSHSDQVFAAIRNLKFMDGNTCTGDAFHHARCMFRTSKGARNNPYVKQEVLLITDGKTNCHTDATIEAQELQAIADIYVLLIGNPGKDGMDQIKSYVSNPPANHLFATSNYTDLSTLVQLVLDQLRTYKSPCMSFNP